MKLKDMLDLDLLVKMEDENFVRAQVHPTEPLMIFNYTERAMHQRVWNDVTHACRGLIYNTDTQEVVARPFPKFFNYGEHDEGTLDLDAEVFVTDKLDGSLGILYREPASGLWSIATRGSFTSEQAVHATELWRRKYDARWTHLRGVTELFEIIYPENRIVLDYGDTDDLFHLGTVEIETGQSYPPRTYGVTPSAEDFWLEIETLRDALAMPPRPNAEGVVVHFVSGPMCDKRVKIKQDAYVKLHRIITGMNARTVWEALGEGKTADELCEGIPEEFWPWIHEVSGELQAKAEDIRQAAEREYSRVLAVTGGAASRKEFAMMAQQSEYRGLLFLLLDERDIRPQIWKSIKPSADRALTHLSEDTA
jgi:RNA ligase